MPSHSHRGGSRTLVVWVDHRVVHDTAAAGSSERDAVVMIDDDDVVLDNPVHEHPVEATDALERTAMRLIDRLVRAGVVRRRREGRRNVYEIVARGALPHPIESRCSLENLLRTVLDSAADSERDN